MIRVRAGIVFSIVGLFAVLGAAGASLPADVAEWVDAVKSQYSGVTIRVSATPHPSIEAFKAMTPEFTELTGIRVEYDEIGPRDLRSQHFMAHTAGTGIFDVLMLLDPGIRGKGRDRTLTPVPR